MPELVSVAVVGVPDDAAGETVALFATARPGAEITPADVLTVCRQHLPKHMVPHSVVILEAMPVTANGKIAKRELREMAAPRAAR
jgi:acyl-CoA synthetase (AMP-forming)/AMP-acid ligase II